MAGCLAAALALLVQALPASAAVSFTTAWGWGVNPVSNVCTTSTSCVQGSVGGGASQFYDPWGVAANGSGDVYVDDYYNQRIDQFSSSGSFVRAWGWGVSDGAHKFETCTTSCQAGIAGGGTGELSYAQGVAVSSSGDVYVADTNNNRIDVFSSSGSFMRAWGWGVSDGANQLEACTASCRAGVSGGGAGQLDNPEDVAVDNSSGDVYIADTDNNRIDEFSSGGGFVRAWGWGVSDGADQFETCTTSCQAGIYGGGAGQVDYPPGVAVGASGDVYVADGGNNRIDEFSSGGGFVRAWGWGVSDGADQFETCTTSCQAGIAGGGAGQLNDAQGVAVDTSGNVYIADALNDRIDEFSSSGSFTQAWGWGVSDGANQFESCTTACRGAVSGGGAGEMASPQGVSVDSNGNVYVADTGDQRIDEFSSGPSFVRAWGSGVVPGADTCASSCQTGNPGGGAGQLYGPAGAAVDNGSGDVYVADSYNNRIDEFSSTGSFIEAWGWGVTDAGSQFEICTASCRSGLISAGAGGFDEPGGVAMDLTSGDLYVADTYNNRIDEFSSSGSFIRAWGWGVSDGASQFETCSTTCQSGISGGGAGEMDQPQGVSVGDSSGNVYVADTYNNRIDEFSSSGSFIRAWGWGVSDGANEFETCATTCQGGIGGGGSGQLDDPMGVAASSAGNLYVADYDNERIDQFSAGGSFIRAWGWGVSDGANKFETCTTSCRAGSYGGGAGQLSDPEGVGVDSSQGVYVADYGNDRIDEFSSGGRFIEAWGWGVEDGQSQLEVCAATCQAGIGGGGAGELDDPTGVAADSPKQVYVADAGSNRIDAFVNSLPSAAIVDRLRVKTSGHELVARWRLAVRTGVAGFDVYAGHQRLNPRVIPLHRSRSYVYRVHWSRPGPFALHVLLRSGGVVIVRA